MCENVKEEGRKAETDFGAGFEGGTDEISRPEKEFVQVPGSALRGT